MIATTLPMIASNIFVGIDEANCALSVNPRRSLRISNSAEAKASFLKK
jgi:hypothetical protein